MKEWTVGTILRLPISSRAQLSLLEHMPGSGRRFVRRLDRVVYVRTDAIEYYRLFRYPRRRFVVAGDWDLKKRRLFPGLMSNPNFSCIYEMYCHGKKYTETAQYDKMMHDLRTLGMAERRFTTKEEIECYFQRLHAVFSDLRQNGYKSQSELGGPPDEEIRVSLGRNGEIIKYHNGHHRLAMARILGIQCLPVCIEFVHREWFLKCSQQYRGSIIHVINRGLRELRSVCMSDECSHVTRTDCQSVDCMSANHGSRRDERVHSTI